MSMFTDYAAYLKDNPQGHWFKRKLYGWGWVPVRWQGWAVLAAFVLYVTVVAARFAHKAEAGTVPNEDVISFTIKIGIAVIVLIALCYLKGEAPRWQWGMPKKENETLS